MCVRGELDLSNSAALGAALSARLARTPQLSLDVSQVAFADVGAINAIYGAVADRPDGHQIIITGVRPHIRRLLRAGGWHSDHVKVRS